MKILVLTDEIYPDGIGGVGKSLYNLCVAWAEAGHEVAVLVRATRSGLASEAFVKGFHIHRFYGPRYGHPLYRLFPISILVKVSRWLVRSHAAFDVIYVNNPWYVMAVALAGTHRAKPIIDMVHIPLAAEIRVNAEHKKYGLATPLARLAASLMRVLENYSLLYVDTILTNSDFVRRELRAGYSHATKLGDLVFLGVDTSVYGPRNKEDARRALGLALDRKVLLTVRRLEGRMGLENLVAAMRRVKVHQPDALLLIGGQGYLRSQIEELIRNDQLGDHVRLIGFVDEVDVPVYMAAADLFVLPTQALEGFGLATIEALACGVPVIGTPVGSTPEILKPIDPQLITQDASAEAIAQAVIGWLARPEALQKVGRRCRGEVEAHYRADRVAQQMIDVFQHAITGKQ
jgi:glycosyltransferase involved in cell wall biosynthesis